MKKLSPTQVNVLKLLLEGDILLNERDNTIYMTDGDGNDYWIRRKTFDILRYKKLIQISSRPSIDIYFFRLSHDGIQYLVKYHYEETKDFFGTVKNESK